MDKITILVGIIIFSCLIAVTYICYYPNKVPMEHSVGTSKFTLSDFQEVNKYTTINGSVIELSRLFR